MTTSILSELALSAMAVGCGLVPVRQIIDRASSCSSLERAERCRLIPQVLQFTRVSIEVVELSPIGPS